MTSRYGAHARVSSRHIFHPHRSVPRQEVDALPNDRRAVLSALSIHTAAINSALKHQRTQQTTVVHELHYNAEQKVLVRSLHAIWDFHNFTASYCAILDYDTVNLGTQYYCFEGKNFLSLQGKNDGQGMFLRHDSNRLTKRMIPQPRRAQYDYTKLGDGHRW
jgi:hypothetical protein